MPDLQNLLDQIDRLDQQATKGPWSATPKTYGIARVKNLEGLTIATNTSESITELIALARTALPQLAKALRGVLDVLDTYPAPSKEADPTGYTTARLALLEQRIREAIGDDDD